MEETWKLSKELLTKWFSGKPADMVVESLLITLRQLPDGSLKVRLALCNAEEEKINELDVRTTLGRFDKDETTVRIKGINYAFQVVYGP